MEMKDSSQTDRKDMRTSRSSERHHDASSLLKPNCVIALSSLATGVEGNFYAARCLAAGIWSLQMQAGLQPYDPSVQLVVLNQNGKFSFRSAIADGRLLCCSSQYHLGFERWEVDSQEAWSLQGRSLSNCTFRNQMHRLTLNVRITVLAEPTDLLGNPRITSALMTMTLPGARPPAESNGKITGLSSAEGGPEQQGIKSSKETLRRFLVKPEINRKASNPFTYTKDGPLCAGFQKSGVSVSISSSSENSLKSKGSPLPKPRLFALSSYEKPEGGRPAIHRVSVNGKATDWKPGTPTRNERLLSTPSFTASIIAAGSSPAEKVDEKQNGSHIFESGAPLPNGFTSEIPRQVRKWKRSIDGIEKLAPVDFGGNFRSFGGLKRSQEPLFTDAVDEDGTLSSPGSIDVSTSVSSGRQSPRVVIKRQPSKIDFQVPLETVCYNAEGTATEDGVEKLKYSESQMKAALENLRNDTARKEKEKIIHWKLQAAVHLLKTETQHNLTLTAKMAFEEAYIRAFQDAVKRNSWSLKDVRLQKKVVSSKERDMTPAITRYDPACRIKLQWTYPSKRVPSVKEVCAVCTYLSLFET
ncbi:hypothetical protein R1sor_027421 [Riccia sorocarpa]|uniref:Uncharacterized protein n=1 Tax=Riccia sorocarpa TaxID=122646 RepID=A0ABD3GE56_9MARC